MTTIADVVRGNSGGNRENPDEREQPVTPLQPLHVLVGHANTTWRLASIPDSTIFVSGSYDGRCRVWSAEDGGEMGHCLRRSDTKLLESASSDGTVKRWKTSNHEQIGASIQHPTALSSDGHYIAAGGEDRKVYIWNLMDRKEVAEIISENPDVSDNGASKDTAKDGARDRRREWHSETGWKESRVGVGKGKTTAQDATSVDELDSHEQRRLFSGFNRMLFKPFR
ncbi:hypothetical protein PAXINDRAFT_15025 [Paxillus involutus ATCC 200175]|uniref:Uncharacterized protein n=1 Tax=Paxillus involutus ATCC 200175 TaxID=664439 RepID=A0A0C9T8Z1_PAXIN|nr:hypothetical protein PAXINDRAFT_15025 [Paxillus involutus ATCC 200175]